jgi:hypothetical protein
MATIHGLFRAFPPWQRTIAFGKRPVGLILTHSLYKVFLLVRAGIYRLYLGQYLNGL